MYAIETVNLHKSYDGLAVLKGLDLCVPQGQVYGLLGPNGSGKSTLIHLLLGFLRPNKGTLSLFGQRDLEVARGRVGYLPERLRYHLRYSGREYLRYLGQFSDLREPDLTRRVEQELAVVGLLDAADRRLATYSKGMLQRFGIAQALLADPDLLLIDEPTSGLDPAGQREMIGLLTELRAHKHTIFLTSHILEEIDQLCDTVGILYGGRLAAEVDVQSLRAPGRTALLTVAHLPPELVSQLQRVSPAVRCSGREITLEPNTPGLQAQVLRALLEADVPIISLEPQGRPLEEIYRRIVRGGPAAPAAIEPPPGLFAPPGHPDVGDTLLNELLSREQEPRDEDRQQES
ncbi:MAG: ABC transporter ATP-binding protein [Kouleothrix sp.]|nr:ABC transporter ATP-binding protein [Kouleothrix sp.]